MNNYFYIDGSALTAQIRQLQRADPSFVGRKLCPKHYILSIGMKRITWEQEKEARALIKEFLFARIKAKNAQHKGAA